MANAVSIRSGLSQHVYIALQITEVGVDELNNTSSLNWALVGWLEAAVSSYWYSQTYHAISVTINGTTVYTRDATTAQAVGIGTTHASEATAQIIASGSITVPHSTDGAKTISASFAMNYRWGGGAWAGSGSLVLTNIARASSITVPTFTLNSSGTITITKANSNFTHSLQYLWGDTSSSGIKGGKGYKGYIVENTAETTVTWSPPLDFARIITSASQGQGTIICYTYNGGALVGQSSAVFTAKVPSSCAPSLSIVTSRVRTNNTAITGYVQGIDKTKVVLTASGQYGATITSYSTTVGETSYAGSSFTSNTLGTSGTISIKSTVTDSRGFSTSKTTSITVTAYSAPKLTNVAAYRCAGSSDSTYSAPSAYIAIKPYGSVTSLNSKNSITCTVQYKKSVDSNWTSTTLPTSSYTLDGSAIKIISAATTNSWDIRVTLTDAFGSATYVATQVPTANAFISIFQSGGEKVAMAIGKVVELTKRVALGWGLVVQAGDYRDSGGSDIYVKNTANVGVKVEEASSSTAIGLFARSNGEHGLWDYSTNYFLLYGKGGVLYLPQAVSGLTSNEYTWLKRGNIVSACSADGGTSGYLHLCRITLVDSWNSEPFIFDVAERFKDYTGHIAIRFANVGNANPDVETFTVWGAISDAYVVHTGTSIYDIYIKKTATYTSDTITTVHRNYGNTRNATITYYDEQVSSLPSGYITAFRLWIEGSNSKELSFLDGTVTMTYSGGSTSLSVTGGHEIFAATPYIDFHYGGSTSDYTARIIENSQGVLTAYNSITSGSDSRLKEDITDVPDVYMELVERLQAKTFHMKTTEDGMLNCGFVAQDVLEIEKELGIEHSVLVRNSGEETTLPSGDTVIAYYSIDYQAYAVLLGEYYRRKLTNIEERLGLLENSNSNEPEEVAAADEETN